VSELKKAHEGGLSGYLPDETPSIPKMILFALQQVLVMFPATVLVALLTGFHVSTTIFASGLATLCFLFITRGKIPLYFGSSFSYIPAVAAITGVGFGQIAPDSLISAAQFGILMSGFVSIAAGLIVSRFSMEKIERVLPPTVTGSIALVIGLSLAAVALTNAIGWNGAELAANSNKMWIVALITLISTILFSVYLKGMWAQIPILLGIALGYIVSIPLGLIDFSTIFAGDVFSMPHFTLPAVSWQAALAIMPIAIATIPESTAHLFQLDIYVKDLARKKGKDPHKYNIEEKLGLNLIGDGVGDIVAALFGGPGGTNYGENISTMAITRNFSVFMLGTAAVIAIILSFFTPLSNLVLSVPSAVINGACIFLFGVIAAQGIAIMINKRVDLFSARNLAVIATILIIALGGTYGFPNGMIPFFGTELPPIAAGALFGILLNLLLSIGKDGYDAMSDEKDAFVEAVAHDEDGF